MHLQNFIPLVVYVGAFECPSTMSCVLHLRGARREWRMVGVRTAGATVVEADSGGHREADGGGRSTTVA